MPMMIVLMPLVIYSVIVEPPSGQQFYFVDGFYEVKLLFVRQLTKIEGSIQIRNENLKQKPQSCNTSHRQI